MVSHEATYDTPGVTELKPVHIGRVLRDAVLFNPQNWQGPTMISSDDILQTVARLFALLEHRRVRYVLVGGIAMLQYVQGRNTQDIDLIMAMSAVQKLPEIQVTEKDHDFRHVSASDLAQIRTIIAELHQRIQHMLDNRR